MSAYILTASGHNHVAYRTLAEAEARQAELLTLLGIRCNIITVHAARLG